jgi:membrane associated rhomboid family serine protease
MKLVKVIVSSNILAFILSLMATGIDFNTYFMGVISPDIDVLIEMNWIVGPENWSAHPEVLIMSLFLHIGIVHLLINLIMLFYINTLEIKTNKFMLVYFISGIVGNLCAVLIEEITVLGASGAILGVIGYAIWSQFREVIWIVVLTIVPGLIIPGISNGAHFGGLLAGLLLGLFSKHQITN